MLCTKKSFTLVYTIFVFTLFFSCKTSVQQKLKLNELFSDHMVLQQNEDATFWGSYTPNETISISGNWDKKTVTSTADENGNWKLRLNTPEAGGPYQVNISTKDSTIVLNDVMVGEVWLASGQSNMQMPLKGWPPNDPIENSEQEIANADYPEIRMFNVTRNYNLKTVDTIGGQWMVSSPKSSKDFSATAYFFAKRLHLELNVPIGIIHSSWGGTVAEAWTSKSALKELGDFDDMIAAIEDTKSQQLTKEWYGQLDSISVPQTNDDWNNLNFHDNAVTKIDFNDEKWEAIDLPQRYDKFDTFELDGAVWFRKDIELNDISENYTLSIGVVDDMDDTYFNGEKVGGLAGYGHHLTERVYTIPKELLKKGKNTIAIRAIDTGGPGTISGVLELSNKNGITISLTGEWKYQAKAEIYNGKFYVFNSDKANLANRPNIMQMGPNIPSVLYNAMINPLVPYTIKGAIWYQGESNVGRSEQYERLFPKLITNWRQQWDTNFPFYYVQIAPYNYGTSPSSKEGSMDLREAQRKSLQTKNTGMVVTMDIGNYTNIHPANKQDVGKRLAGLALANDYNKEMVASGPLYKGHEISQNILTLEFDFVGTGLLSKDPKLSGFEIAGEDKKYVPADAEIVSDKVRLQATSVANPKYARYAWSDNGIASLFNKEGLPASSFKTED